ncbi:MAG: radical SAM protein, partial [Candidatus Omnitrophica bacterium]|nr:radical SAM protein [Candidatus Omnitrophota bacterium]
MYPTYLESHQNGTLGKIVTGGFELLEYCSICPRKCKVNRLKGQKGFCRSGLKPIVYNYMAHPGEEPPISGERGSGTIFFSGCNMSCSYC